jgi:predicted DNA binding CopG/RHH family protein
MKKNFPIITSDEEAEKLLDEDLSDFITTDNFKPVTFEFQPKNKNVNIRVPEKMLEAVKTVSQREGISYQKYIRRAIERSLGEE